MNTFPYELLVCKRMVQESQEISLVLTWHLFGGVQWWDVQDFARRTTFTIAFSCWLIKHDYLPKAHILSGVHKPCINISRIPLMSCWSYQCYKHYQKVLGVSMSLLNFWCLNMNASDTDLPPKFYGSTVMCSKFLLLRVFGVYVYICIYTYTRIHIYIHLLIWYKYLPICNSSSSACFWMWGIWVISNLWEAF